MFLFGLIVGAALASGAILYVWPKVQAAYTKATKL